MTLYPTAFYDAFHPIDQPSAPMFGPIPTSTDANPSFIMPHPDLEIPDYPDDDTPFLLFRTEQMGNPFKMEDDSMTEAVMTRQQLRLYIPQPEETEIIESSVARSFMTNSEIQVTVYPNPVGATELLHVDLLDYDDALNINYELFDATGKVLISGQLQQKQNILDISMYAAGVYSLRLLSFATIENHLIIKQ